MQKLMIPLLLVAFFAIACKEKKAVSDETKQKLQEALKKDDASAEPVSKNGTGSGTGEYDISAPKGWEKTNRGNSVVLMSPLEGNTDRFRENINVNTEDMRSISLSEYMTISEKNMGTMLQGYSRGESGETTIDGNPAQWFDYNHTYNGMDISARVYVIAKDNMAYLITATAPRDKLSKINGPIEEAIQSFHIK